MGLFLTLGLFLRDLERVKKLRWLMAAGAIGLLGITLVLGKAKFGATNWITLGGLSFQPSEIAKICYIFAGSATLERLFRRRNLTLFIVLTGVCIGLLGLMSDFGTAAIFFVTFLVIAYLRSGDAATLCPDLRRRGVRRGDHCEVQALYPQPLCGVGPRVGGGLRFRLPADPHHVGGGLRRPVGHGGRERLAGKHSRRRIRIWCSGCCARSGGWSSPCWRWRAFSTLAWFAVRASRAGRSSFYTIAACAAGSLLVFQTCLNVFGSVDMLPLTGVTFPFVSNGGSAMISAWGLLAYLKAMDTREDASFAIGRMPQRKLTEETARRTGEQMDDPFGKEA